jgi:hypothetical protein
MDWTGHRSELARKSLCIRCVLCETHFNARQSRSVRRPPISLWLCPGSVRTRAGIGIVRAALMVLYFADFLGNLVGRTLGS